MEDVNYRSKNHNEHAYDAAYEHLQRSDRETADKLKRYLSVFFSSPGEVDLERDLSHAAIVEQVGHDFSPESEIQRVVDAARVILSASRTSPVSSASASPDSLEGSVSLDHFQMAVLNIIDRSPGHAFAHILIGWIRGAGVEVRGVLTGFGEGELILGRECRAVKRILGFPIEITLPERLLITADPEAKTFTLHGIRARPGVCNVVLACKQIKGEWKLVVENYDIPFGFGEFTAKELQKLTSSFKWEVL